MTPGNPELFGPAEGAEEPSEDTPSNPFTGGRADEVRARIGRPRGARNKKSEALEAWYFAKGYLDPIVRLAELVTEDPRVLQAWLDEHAGVTSGGNKRTGPSILEVVHMQISAAGELMPYLHGKKPIDINVTDERLPTLILVTGDNQLAQAQRLLAERQALSVGAPLVDGEANEIKDLEGGK